MDHRGKKLLGFFALFLTASSAVWAADVGQSFRELSWLAPEGRLEALTSEPVTRISVNEINLVNIEKIAAGQSLFHSPNLLGGQAAKAGISCASCHTNGRTNPHFQFPGVSGAPGTADVTHSFFSSQRGDGKFNPVPIPDLTKPGKISHDRESRDLEKFVRGLIVEEFDGAEPGKAALDALGAYIRAISSPSDEEQDSFRSPISLEMHRDRIEEAVESGIYALRNRDNRLANMLFAAARHQCGEMYKRFAVKPLEPEAKKLETLARNLGVIQAAVDDGDSGALRMLDEWSQEFSRTMNILGANADASLYNRIMLKKALAKLDG